MMRWPFVVSLVLIACIASVARAQLPPEQAAKTFTLSDKDLEFTLWASEPLFSNPTCIDIDHKGRVWVCESVNYRHKLFNRPPNRPEGDRILILADTKGTGKADKVTVFYQAPDLLAPLGIAVAKDPVGPGYKVYVCHSPDILVFEDRDGDGKADGPPKKLLSGFRGVDHDHGVHGILIGPDGKLYFSVGDQGVKDLQSSDGKGKKWTTNNTDCQAGTIWRCDLDGKNLELIAHNFRNEYEPCVDSFGSIFVSDNDDDGNQQTRICYVMPGGNYGYWPRGPGQSHWHEEQPGVVPKILRTYFGSPTGMCVYEGTLLPKKYWGQLLHTDAGPRHVRCYHLKPHGAGYDVDREDMVQSTDNWFRPSDICVAPDGSVFVSDWYDPGVGGHGMGDRTRGRIYRLAPKGNKYSLPAVDLATPEGIAKALGSPNLAVRYMAMAALRTVDEKTALVALEIAQRQQQNPWLRARAMCQYMELRQAELKTRRPIPIASNDERIAMAWLRMAKAALGMSPIDYSGVDGWSTVSDPTTDREMLLLLRDVDPSQAKGMILGLAHHYDGKDRFYLAAVGIAVGQDPKRREIILKDFDKEFPEWNDKVANLVWELRPPKVMPQLEKRLADASLPATQRRQIADILAGNPDAGAGKSLLVVLKSDLPAEVRERVVEDLKQALPGKWRDLRRSPEFDQAVERLLARTETQPAAFALIGAAGRTEYVPKMASFVHGGTPEKVVYAAIRTLGEMPGDEAVSALAKMLNFDPPVVTPEVLQALGRHAERQPWRGGPNRAAEMLERHILSPNTYPGEARMAAVALAGSRAGAIWLLDTHAKKQLPDPVVQDVARLLRNSPHQDLRNRALAAFPPPRKLDPKQLPEPAMLARRRGDEARGKQLLAASAKNDLQCLKCHTVQGTGGQIGPDLSAIGKKASRENLFESILLPSKAIADQYVTWVVETKQGLVLTGLVVEDTADHVLLRDANGKDTRVAKKDIESRTKSPTSLMPSDLLAYMTDEDLVDIVEYLFTLK